MDKIEIVLGSVLCLGKLSEPSEAIQRWKDKLTDLQSTASCHELLGIDGDPVDLVWNILPEIWR